MKLDDDGTFERFLRQIGLTEGDFAREDFNEFWDRCRKSSDSGNVRYSEARHAYALVQGTPYTAGTLSAARRRYSRLREGEAFAGEELLLILDRSRPRVCSYLFDACRRGDIGVQTLALGLRRMVNYGDVVETLKGAGCSPEEIAAMFLQAGQLVMSRAEVKALGNLPERVTVYRGHAGEAPAEVAEEVSWSLSRDCAHAFAKFGIEGRHGQPRLWRATVAREDILVYLKDCGEEEVVLKLHRVESIAYETLEVAGRSAVIPDIQIEPEFTRAGCACLYARRAPMKCSEECRR